MAISQEELARAKNDQLAKLAGSYPLGAARIMVAAAFKDLAQYGVGRRDDFVRHFVHGGPDDIHQIAHEMFARRVGALSGNDPRDVMYGLSVVSFIDSDVKLEIARLGDDQVYHTTYQSL